MTAQEKIDFWQKTDPKKLRRLGDRLMAESLPMYESTRPREEVGQEFAQVRQSSGWSAKEAGELLGVTENMILAWETDTVKTPECGVRALRRLVELRQPVE